MSSLTPTAPIELTGTAERWPSAVDVADSIVGELAAIAPVDTDDAAGNDPSHPQIFSIETSRVLCAPEQGSCRADTGQLSLLMTVTYVLLIGLNPDSVLLPLVRMSMGDFDIGRSA